MNSNKSGQSKIIVVVVLVIIAVVAIVYFMSAPTRTRMQSAFTQFTDWTPENIAKDPESYLTFCEQEANKVLEKLKASQIRVAQNRASLEARKKDTEDGIAYDTKQLGTLKELYKTTCAANSWPATWNGAPRDENMVKQQIVMFAHDLPAKESLKTKVEASLKQCDAQALKIQAANAQTQEQLAQIKTSRETLKVQKITEDLSKQLATISSTLSATISTATETTGAISPDQLRAEAAATVDDSEFKKIMGN